MIDSGAHINLQGDVDGKTALIWAVENNNLEAMALLIQEGAGLNLPDGIYQKTALMWAIEHKNIKAVKVLLQAGANVNMKDEKGQTVLMMACKKWMVSAVYHLIKAGAHLELKNREGDTALIIASKYSFTYEFGLLDREKQQRFKIETVKLLLAAGANINIQNKNKESAAMCLADCLSDSITQSKRIRYEIQKILLRSDVDADKPNAHGRTLLMQTAGYKEKNNDSTNADADQIDHHTQFLEKLVLKGADINSQDSHGQTPLMYAAKNGCVNNIKFLLKSGAALNAQDSYGNTALVLAAINRQSASVQLLAEPDEGRQPIADKSDSSSEEKGHIAAAKKILDLRKSREQERSKERSKRKKRQQDKVEYGSIFSSDDDDDVTNAVEQWGPELFFKTVLNNDVTLLEHWLEAGADPNQTYNVHWEYRNSELAEHTPLTLAVSEGFTHIVKLLIKYGAKIDALASCDQTALMMAVKKQHFEIANLLISSGLVANRP